MVALLAAESHLRLSAVSLRGGSSSGAVFPGLCDPWSAMSRGRSPSSNSGLQTRLVLPPNPENGDIGPCCHRCGVGARTWRGDVRTPSACGVRSGGARDSQRVRALAAALVPPRGLPRSLPTPVGSRVGPLGWRRRRLVLWLMISRWLGRIMPDAAAGGSLRPIGAALAPQRQERRPPRPRSSRPSRVSKKRPEGMPSLGVHRQDIPERADRQ